MTNVDNDTFIVNNNCWHTIIIGDILPVKRVYTVQCVFNMYYVQLNINEEPKFGLIIRLFAFEQL